MIAEINKGIIIFETEKADNLGWDGEPFCDAVWHQWLVTPKRRKWDPLKFANCYWMILE